MLLPLHLCFTSSLWGSSFKIQNSNSRASPFFSFLFYPSFSLSFMSPFYASFSLSPSIPLCCCAATFVPPPHYLLHQIVTRGLLLFLLLLLLPKDKTPSPPPKRQKVFFFPFSFLSRNLISCSIHVANSL